MSKINLLQPEKDDQGLSFKLWAILVAVFTAVLAVIFKDFVFHLDQLLIAQDQMRGLGVRYLIDNGFTPQWNPYILGGMSTLDATFGAILHPFIFLENIFGHERGIGFKFIACTWLAFVGGLPLFSLLARSWKIGAVVALLFSLNPQFFTHIYGGHDGKMMVISVLPLALWGLFLITRKNNWIGIFWMSIGIALMILSSQLQTTYYCLLGLLPISLFECFLREKVSNWKLAFTKQASIGLAVATALAIGAVQIIPPIDYTTSQSIRSTASKTTIEHATSWSIHPEEAASILLPGFSGNLADKTGKESYWGINVFKLNHDAPGTLLLILGLAAFAGIKRRKEQILWLSIMVTALIYALGAHTPWFQIFYEILPKAKMFRAPSMVLFWIPTALAILAANYLGDIRKGEEKLSTKALGILATVFIAFTIARSYWIELPYAVWASFVLLMVLYTLASLGFQDKGQTFKLDRALNAVIDYCKSKPGIALGFSLPLLALLPMKSSQFVQTNNLSDALNPLENWQASSLEVMKNQSGETLVSLIIALALLGLVSWALRKANTWNFAFLALAIVGGLEAWFIDSKFIQVAPRDQFFTPEAQNLAEQIRKTTQGENYRVLNLGQSIQDEYGPYYKLRFALGFHDNEIASYRAYRSGGDDNTRMGNLLWTPSPALIQSVLQSKGMDSTQITSLFAPKPIDILTIFLSMQYQGAPLESIRQQLAQAPQEQLQTMWSQAQQELAKMPKENSEVLMQQAAQIGSRQALLPIAIQEGLNPYLNLLGVKAIVSGEQIMENPKALARWTGYGKATVIANSADAIKAIANSDYSQTIILEEAPKIAPSGALVQAKLTKVNSGSSYEGTVQAQGNGIVLFNENYSPNWEVKINGQDAVIHRAFGTFLAFEVPAGNHNVTVQYNSKSVERSLPITTAGGIALFLVLGLGIFANRRKTA